MKGRHAIGFGGIHVGVQPNQRPDGSSVSAFGGVNEGCVGADGAEAGDAKPLDKGEAD
jgi:hypothetical protein